MYVLAAPLLMLARLVEPFYAGAVSFRNGMFDAGIRKAHRLPRPVVSIGNITTGGTGKTPVIRWLAERLRNDGKHVCVLSRGYKARPGELGDELTMLSRMLNGPETIPVKLIANANRYAAGVDALRNDSSIDCFLLDDGFQHRKVSRDVDVVLISALNPFGFGHVLPAGLMREPMWGLRRASAFVITHVDRAEPASLANIKQSIRRYNAGAPIVRATHALRGFRSAGVSSTDDTDIPLPALKQRKWMPICGIANPSAFIAPLAAIAGNNIQAAAFGDHHDYTEADLLRIRNTAIERGASVLVTTEKDWVKLARFPLAFDDKLPIWRTEMQIEFQGDGEARLLEMIRDSLRSARSGG